MRYSKGVEYVISNLEQRRECVTHILTIVGPANSGKSYWVSKMFGGQCDFLQYSGTFFTGFTKQFNRIAVFDDAKFNLWSDEVIKKIGNHTQYRAPIKGSYREFNYELVIFICNSEPHNEGWDDAVYQRLGLHNNGERGTKIDWPNRIMGPDGNLSRKVVVPMELATIDTSYPAIRGLPCFSDGTSFDACKCGATCSWLDGGECPAIKRQREFGPGVEIVIPTPIDETKEPGYTNRASDLWKQRLLQQVEQQEQPRCVDPVAEILESQDISESTSSVSSNVPVGFHPALDFSSESDASKDGLESGSESEASDEEERRKLRQFIEVECDE
jgi:hypothetical protein